MNRDMPAIASSTYTTSAMNINEMMNANVGMGGVGVAQMNNLAAQVDRRLQQAVLPVAIPNQLVKQEIPMAIRRLVQVFIADPNENLSPESSLLYSGDQKLTDATDQELFFEIDIKNILEKHNAVRAKTVDKKVKERTEYLEPAKIRDLKMVVVTVAGF